MLISRATFLRVFLLLGPLTLQVLGCKVHKLLMFAPHRPWAYLFQSIRWDVIFLSTVLLLFLALLEGTTGWRRKVSVVLLHLTATLLMVLSTLEHGFFVTTGSIPDWHLLQYSIDRASDAGFLALMRDILLGVKMFLLLLPLAFALFPLFVERLGPIKRWLEGTPAHTTGRFHRWAWVFPIVLVACLILPAFPVKGTVGPLRSNFYINLVNDGINAYQGTPKVLLRLKKVKVHGAEAFFDTSNMRLLPFRKPRKMNVVIVLLESIRARSITPYNPKMPTTPFLANIAKRSVKIDDMSAVLPHTSKSLVPILCGVPSKVTIRIVEGKFGGLPARCLPHLLKPLGYRSAFFQPATIHFEDRAGLVDNMGFDVLKGHEDFNTKGFAKTNYFGYEDQIMFKPSLRWLDQTLKTKDPFLLTYLLLVSHHTYTTPPSFPKKKYTNSTDKELNNYLNSLRYIDNFLADLFAQFKRRGLYDNTIFMFVADHGEAFGEHGRRQHDNVLWQETLRVPAFLFSPKLWPQGGHITGPRQQLDIAPTLVELLGFRPTQGHFPGTSLFRPVSPKRKLFFSCWYEQQCLGMRHGKYKYVYHYRRRPMELYDLKKDPYERKSLAGQPAFPPKRFKAAEREMLMWREKINGIYEQASKQRIQQAISKKQPDVQHRSGIHLGDYIRFVGYNLRTPWIRRGGTIDITYVFQALRRIPRSWNLFFHVNVRRPQHFLNADHIPVGGTYPPHKWKAKEYIQDRQRIRIPRNFPAGAKVQIYIGMWAKRRGRQPLLAPKGQSFRSEDSRLLVAEIPILP